MKRLKYIKTFEDLSSFYPKDDYWLVVTKDEKFLVFNPFNMLNKGGGKWKHDPIGKDKSFYMINTDYLVKEMDVRFIHENKDSAQKFIDMIDNGPNGYKDIDLNGDVDINLKVKKAEWDVDVLPYKGRINVGGNAGLNNDFKRKFPDGKIDRLYYHVGDLIFMQDNFNRYEEYNRYGGSEHLYTDLKNNCKIVSYSTGLFRNDNINDVLGF